MKQNRNDSRRNFLINLATAGVVATCMPHLLLATGNPANKQSSQGRVILFQGDSITDGNRGRNKDLNHIMGHGYVFAIASRVGADHPERNLKFINRGISGNKVTDLEKRWQTDALDLKPDVLSILIGVNDAAQAIKQQDKDATALYETTYRSLMEQTKQQNPEIRLVLCEPFALPVGRVKESWDTWHNHIAARQEVVKRLATTYDAVFVPFQRVFDEAIKKAPAAYWIWDGIHPTVAGHELMAREWLKQVKKKVLFR